MPTPLRSHPMFVFFDGIGETGSASITANNFSPPTGFAASNLGNSQLLTSTCRTPSLTTNQILAFDLLAVKEINCFALMGSNATLAATGRFRAADDAAFTIGVVESGGSLTSVFDSSLGHARAIYVPPWNRTIIYLLANSITKRYYRWHQSDSTNPDGYQEWSIARFGLGFQPAYSVERILPKPIIEGPPGSEKLIRSFEITYHNTTRSEAFDFQSILGTILTTRRVLLIPRPLQPATWLQEAIWCTLDKSFVREPVAKLTGDRERYRVVATFVEVDQ